MAEEAPWSLWTRARGGKETASRAMLSAHVGIPQNGTAMLRAYARMVLMLGLWLPRWCYTRRPTSLRAFGHHALGERGAALGLVVAGNSGGCGHR